MGLSKFFVIALLATSTLAASIEPRGDCSFDYSSSEGSQKKFNVILKDKITAKSHFEWLKNCFNKSVNHILNVDYSKDFEENDVHDFSVEDALYGYSTFFDPNFVNQYLKHNDDVKLAVEDAEVSINFRNTFRKNPNPNLDRIDQKDFPLDKKYTYPLTAGNGTTVYIVDTGIFIKHNEFEGRAVHGGSFCAGCPNTDDDGHGTHVAAIVGGKTYGVANKVKLVAVKVLNAKGGGSTSEIVAGLSFVLSKHKKNPKENSVVNMSLGSEYDQGIINAAVKALTDNGVHVVVAAGNDSDDACSQSPASAKTAITVGATKKFSDDVTDFSNIGKCVDIFAPGEKILSAFNGDKNDSWVYSGTSQATPHVTGTVALIIGQFGNSPVAEMAKTLNKFATKGVISKKTLKGSPNVFLRVPFNEK